jgi:ubiquitin C-terminal hydrolase
MTEAPGGNQHVLVPGMCNTGNTCYLNAALQAMASSQLLCEGISQLAGVLQASSSSTTEQKQSPAGQLLAVIKAAVKFILHGGLASCFATRLAD